MKGRLLVIGGPTRTGKTSLALSLAKRFSGEIISCDSRQVYIGMDIGTGKIPKAKKIIKEKGKWFVDGLPIHLYDVAKPDETFSVARYHSLVYETLEDIWGRKKLPILVGGTGFYIKAILDGIETIGIPPNWELRTQLENLTAEVLFKKLSKIDPQGAKTMNPSDKKNPRRLIRAIEIALQNQKPKGRQSLSVSQRKSQKSINERRLAINSLVIGLMANRKVLYQKADRWVEEILQGGLINEVMALLKKGYKSTIPLRGLIYKPTVDFIEGKLTIENLKEILKRQMRDYIKRQLTWFLKDKRIIWVEIKDKNFQSKVEKIFSDFIKN